MAEKQYCVCPICQEKSSDITYNTNSNNFSYLNFSIGGNGPMMGGGSTNYSFKVCKKCEALPATDANGIVAKIKALLAPVKASDDALQNQI